MGRLFSADELPNVVLCTLSFGNINLACQPIAGRPFTVSSCSRSSFSAAHFTSSFKNVSHGVVNRRADQAREDGLVTVDMGPPELNGPKVPSTLPTNADGVVLKEPIQVRFSLC